MGIAAAGYGLIVLVVGAVVGWNARRAHSLHGDIKVYKSRLPAFRKTRNRSGLTAILVVLLALFVIGALVHA